MRYIPVLQYQDLNSLNWSWAKYRLSDPNEGFFYKLEKAYHYTSPKSRKTWRWIRVGESKNVTPMSRATPISNALADSTCGGYRPWVSCRWYGVTIGTIIWAHMYPYVIHLIVRLPSKWLYPAHSWHSCWWAFDNPAIQATTIRQIELSLDRNQSQTQSRSDLSQNKCHFWTQHPWKPLYRHFV
mgnify:CR=1 FL=1